MRKGKYKKLFAAIALLVFITIISFKCIAQECESEIQNIQTLISNQNFKEAELILKRNLDKNNSDICEAIFSLTLGGVYSINEAKFSETEKLLKKSLKIFSNLSLTESKIYLDNLYMLASLYDNKRLFRESLAYFQEYLNITTKIYSINSFEYIKAKLKVVDNYQNLGDLYNRNLHLNESILKAKELENTVISNQQYGFLLSEIGILFSQSNEYEKAVLFLKNSIQISDKNNRDNFQQLQYTYGYLTSALMKIGNYNEAEHNSLDFINLSKKYTTNQSPQRSILQNLIRIYEVKGDNYKAEVIMQNLDSIYYSEKINSSDYVDYLLQKGRFYYRNGRSEEAQSIILNAFIEDKKNRSDPFMHLLAIYNIAKIFQEFQDYKKELEYRIIARDFSIDNKIKPDILIFKNSIRLYNLFIRDKNKKSEQVILKEINDYYFKNKENSDSALVLEIKEQYLTLLSTQSSFSECKKIIIEIDNISNKIYGENSINRVNVLIRFADFYEETGQYNDLNTISNIILTKLTSLEYAPTSYKLSIYNRIAGYYYFLKKYADSKNILEISEKLFSKLDDKKLTLYADYLNTKSMVLFKLNDIIGGESAIFESAEIKKTLYSENSDYYRTSLHNIGLYYQNIRNNIQALKYYNLALTDNNRGNKRTLNNLLSVYIDLKQYDSARQILQKIEKVVTNYPTSSDSLEFARLYLDYARFYRSYNKLDLALEYFLKTESILEKNKEIFPYDYGVFASEFGIYFDKKEDNLSSLKYSKISFDQHLSRNLKDEVLIRRSANYAYDLLINGQLNNAETLIKESARLLDSILSLNSEYISISDLSNLMLEYSGETSLYNSFLSKHLNSSAAEEILNLNLNKRSFSLNKYSKLASSPLLITNQKYANSYKNYKSIRNQISINTQTGNTSNNNKLYEFQDSLERIMYKLNVTNKVFEYKKTWENIRNKLSQNEAAVLFDVSVNIRYNIKLPKDSNQYFAFIIRRDESKPRVILLGNESQIFKSSQYYSFINEHDKLYSVENNNLYEFIWKRLENSLKGIKRVFISPAARLNTISFSAIPLPNYKRVIDDYEILNIKNLKNINDTSRYGSMNNNISLFGGIDFDKFPTLTNKMNPINSIDSVSISYLRSLYKSKWPSLPYTKSEVFEINSILSKNNMKTSLFTSNDASEEAFKNQIDAGIIHLATHGYYTYLPDTNIDKTGSVFYLSKDPLTRSGLIFAGGNNTWQENKINLSHQDGVLTAREISTLDLSFCRLVVLSACETGLGDIQYDEDVYGLQRAFKMAGVKNIIASLWKVPDYETSEFMKLFYLTLISDNYNIKSAFYKTQLEMKNRFKQPSKWGGFILIE